MSQNADECIWERMENKAVDVIFPGTEILEYSATGNRRVL